MTNTNRREELFRSLPQEEVDALSPLSTRRLEEALKRAEADRNAVTRAEQTSRVAPNLRFR